MAMIVCPNCGESVSDKAVQCVHCGAELTPAATKKCMECGAELANGATSCPKCGCPVETISGTFPNENTPKNEISKAKNTKRVKIIIGFVVIILIISVVTIFGIRHYQEKKAAEEEYARMLEEQKAAEEHEQMLQEYYDNLNLATLTMLRGAADAETNGNLIKQVWYNAIYKKSDSETDPFTQPDGFFVSDFNTALMNLFSDTDFLATAQTIKDNQASVNSLMKDLKNPPEEYEDAYDELLEFYDAYISLTNMVLDPSGTLQTFSTNFYDADSEALNCYNSMKLYLDE